MTNRLQYPYDSDVLLRKYIPIRQELLSSCSVWLDKRIAVLGGSTTTDIIKMIELFLLSQGIRAEFYESGYGQYWQEAMFPSVELETFKPDIIFFHTTLHNFECYSHYEQMWERVSFVYRCPIIQNNFEYPYYRLMGNRDVSHGKVFEVSQMNLKFAEYARAHGSFFINDINWLSADYGLEAWSDPFYWHMYKYALSVHAIPRLAQSVSNIIKSIFGKNKKVFALDLDNTLWGGIVGEDGADNIEMGQETSVGQTYSEFQQYLKDHKKLGVILSVVSKNEHENAIAGLSRPDCLLNPDDFVSIKANWELKSKNIVDMARELALLPESFVFVDDNPAEREIVRQQVSSVAVPEISTPEYYIKEIDRNGYFEVTNLSPDDINRTEMYKNNFQRHQHEASFADYHEYLRSLKMVAEIQPFAAIYMSRIAQLTNKSNQFNLTTLRCTQGEIEGYAAEDKYITLYGKLADKFGDNGVVSVIIGEIQGTTLHISLWLMSCRVFKRDMELAMMDELVRLSRLRGITELQGYYYPTTKNAIVKDFYATQGFEKISEDKNGNAVWRLNINGYTNKQYIISVNGGSVNDN